MRVARIRGVEIYVDFSWYIIAVLLVISFTSSFVNVGVSDGTALLAGISTAALLFLSILAHELGHAEAGRRFGVATRWVNLHLLGGAAHFARNPRTPAEEYGIAAAGPATSLGLGVMFYGLSAIVPGVPALVLSWIGVMNLVLAAFNVLPAFPLDGGRMLRGWLWERSGDMTTATQRTVQVGSIVGTLMFVVAFIALFTLGALTALLLAATALFLKVSGRLELFRLQMRQSGRSLFDILQQQQGGRAAPGFGGFSGSPRPRPQSPPEGPRESRPATGKRTVILQDGTEIQIDD